MKLLRRVAVLASVVTLGLCTIVGAARAESTLQTVLKRGEFLAGITADSPPSAYLDAQGRQVGYCADVARYLARRLGVKLTFVPVTAASRIPLLTTGRIDAEVAVTTPQKNRCYHRKGILHSFPCSPGSGQDNEGIPHCDPPR